MLIAKSACVVLAAVVGCTGSRDGRTVKVSSYGFDPQDSTRFLQSAFDSGVRKVVIDRQKGDWITRPLFITNSNLEVVLEDGVTLRAMRGQFRDPHDSLIEIGGGASNVTLRGEGGAVLRMNKADYHDPKQGYPFSEWRMGVNIVRSRDVTVRNLTILSTGGDGVYVGRGARNVLLEDLVCRDNNRQGLSVTDVQGLTVRRCALSDTRGTAPQSGFDIEPNAEQCHASDVLFEDCVFDGNAMHGFDMHFGWFTARTAPVSVTYRRCSARGNGGCGVTFMAADPKFSLAQGGPVKGTVRFEDCSVSGNTGEALKIINHLVDGTDISFSGCTFDARGTRAESAILFTNAQMLRDFGGVAFENCRVLVDRGCKPCEFEAQPGIGIAPGLRGVLTVECDGVRSAFDLAAFAARHTPHPELVSEFRSPLVDYRTLAAPSAAQLKGIRTPEIRTPSFVFVQAVPAAGEYPVGFRTRRLRKAGDAGPCATVQLFDAAGTDLGKFNVPEGDFTYAVRASGPNVYRFEIVQRDGCTISIASKTPGGALLADRPINLFRGENVSFHFPVPAGAGKVQVEIRPEEAVSAELYDAAGRKVASMPCQTKFERFEVKCEPTAADGVWTLRFPRIAEDAFFQVGGDALPLLSTERAGTVRMR